MRYTTYGNTGMRVSALGFGCMRLPMKGATVDRDKSTPMLLRAHELGVNFFDTAIGYCNGDSQAAVGEALEPIRSKVIISTKNHNHTAKPGEWRRHLEDSLRFLRTDYIDIYNHHGIQWNTFVELLDPTKGGLLAHMIKAKEEGLLRHVGFSFHDAPESLRKLVDTGYFESVILQYNLLDQGNADVMMHAHRKGLGIVVMGPVGGGRLGLPSEHISDLTGGAAKSTPEAALRFVWAHPGVNVALSGMETVEMLEQNVAIASNTTPFTSEQVDALNRLVEERKKKSGLYCTACKYCMPACAVGVSIPEQLDLLNLAKIYGFTGQAKERYNSTWAVRVKARECSACRKCVEKCPQNIDIPARMREVITLLDPQAGTVVVETAVENVKADGSFGVAVRTHSLADEPRTVGVKLSGRDGAEFKPPRLEFDAIPAFGRRTRLSAGVIPPTSRHIDFGLEVTRDGATDQIDKHYEFVLLHKGLADSWEGGQWHEAAPKEEQFSSAKQTAVKHGLRFKLSYDGTGILLLADVRDDFLFPSTLANKGQLVDGLELFLDGRVPSKVGGTQYGDNVFQIGLYPGTPGSCPAFYNVCNTTTDVPMEISSERTAQGYRIRARVPFSSFCATTGIPEKIGFDLAANTADSTGNRIAQYAWAGGPDNWQNAGNFREVWLVQ